MKRLTRRSRVGESLPVKHLNLMYMDTTSEDTLTEILESLAEYEEKNALKPIEDWHEDYGDCLWWSFPIEEPPYCGNPLDCDFPNSVTHFTRLFIPEKLCSK